MTSVSARTLDSSLEPLQVVFVIYPDIVLLDLAGPLSVFSWARHRDSETLAYQVAITSLGGGRIATDAAVSIDAEPIETWVNQPIHTLIVVGGDGAYEAMYDGRLIDHVKALAANSQRVCSVCSGALILAAAGLLDGHRSTTHWEDCDLLADLFPNVHVEPDPIYIKSGIFWTSAGVTAGTDMALAIVAEDLGSEAALERAQKLVTYMVRPGGQSQFSPALERQKLDKTSRFAKLHQWISENIQNDLSVEVLADQENMSTRNFYRHYALTMKTTPAKAVERIRTEAARELLETTEVAIKAVATRCGFGDEERMRRSFLRLIGVPPLEYRQRFRIGQNNS
ncbi:MAG: helix-turn-helix domain-containing protein [Pseudomonadota bacterium]